MVTYIVKILISAILIVAVTEVAKKSSLWASLLASLPVSTLMSMVWIYAETKDAQKVAELCQGIFWLLIPSFILLFLFPFMIKRGQSFGLSLVIAVAATVIGYWGMTSVLKKFG